MKLQSEDCYSSHVNYVTYVIRDASFRFVGAALLLVRPWGLPTFSFPVTANNSCYNFHSAHDFMH
jgi:hypothetical protein